MYPKTTQRSEKQRLAIQTLQQNSLTLHSCRTARKAETRKKTRFSARFL